MKFCENSKLKKFKLADGIPIKHNVLKAGQKRYDLCEITDAEAAELHQMGNSQVIPVAKADAAEPANVVVTPKK
jgi:hypothetical protein